MIFKGYKRFIKFFIVICCLIAVYFCVSVDYSYNKVIKSKEFVDESSLSVKFMGYEIYKYNRSFKKGNQNKNK